MEKVFYPVIFHPEEVGFSTFVPDLDGCFSQGDTMSEAVAMTRMPWAWCWRITSPPPSRSPRLSPRRDPLGGGGFCGHGGV